MADLWVLSLLPVLLSMNPWLSVSPSVYYQSIVAFLPPLRDADENIPRFPTNYDLALPLCGKQEPNDSVSNQGKKTNTCRIPKSCKLHRDIYLHHEKIWLC